MKAATSPSQTTVRSTRTHSRSRSAIIAVAAIASAVPVSLSLATPAAAQSPQLEQACLTVAKTFLLTNTLKTGVVQSFPELDPPGARLTYSTREDAKPTDFSSEIDCQFDKASPPMAVLRFCISDTCYGPNEQDPEKRRRYQEVKAVMDRHK